VQASGGEEEGDMGRAAARERIPTTSYQGDGGGKRLRSIWRVPCHSPSHSRMCHITMPFIVTLHTKSKKKVSTGKK